MIKEIFDNISDEELLIAVQEVLESENTGLIGDTVKKYAKIFAKISGESMSMHIMHAETLLSNQAAFRWAEIKKSK